MNYDKFIRLRKEFHKYPELSGQEIQTSEKIRQQLETCSPTRIHSGIGGHGVIAEFCFSDQGPSVLFRADIDAIAVTETSHLSYISQHPGIAHKCGHDGHTAILLAFAGLLHQQPLSQGRIYLLFQPSEENGKGAQAVLSHPFFRNIKIDKAFALHNLPGYPEGSIICRPRSFTCSVISCTVRIHGKTAHAAEPEKSIPPTPALLEILRTTQQWDNNNPGSTNYLRSTLIELHIGKETYGVAAGEGLIRFTFRAATDKNLQKHIQLLEHIVKKTTADNPGLSSSVEWLEAFTANENNPEMVACIREAALKNNLTYETTPHPFAWGEDFGLFTQQYPGAIFGLGAGLSTPPLHSPDYDFPDEIIKTGAQMFYEIAALQMKI